MTVSLISSRLANHRWEQHPSFHLMLVISFLKPVPIGKEAITITQDNLMLEKAKEREDRGKDEGP